MKNGLVALLTLFVACTIIISDADAVKKKPKLVLPKTSTTFKASVPNISTIGAVRSVSYITPNWAKVYNSDALFEWTNPDCTSEKACKVIIEQKDKDNKTISTIVEDNVIQNNFKLNSTSFKLQPGSFYTLYVIPAGDETKKSNPVEAVVESGASPLYFYSLSETERNKIKKELSIIQEPDKQDRQVREANVFIKNGVWFDAVNKVNSLINAGNDSEEYTEFKKNLYDTVTKDSNVNDESDE